MPSKFREDLGDKFYVCRGLDGCLFLLSQSQWDSLVEKVSAIPLAQGKGIQRYFFSGAAEVEPDKQGRILIPPNLRDHAGLTRDVTVIGAAVLLARRQGERLEERRAVCCAVCVTAAICTTVGNTLVNWLDSVLLNYYTPALIFGDLIWRLIVGMINAVVMASIAIPLVKRLRRWSAVSSL